MVDCVSARGWVKEPPPWGQGRLLLVSASCGWWSTRGDGLLAKLLDMWRRAGVQILLTVAVMLSCTPVWAKGGPYLVEQQPLVLALVADPHCTRGTDDDQPMYRGRFEKAIAAVNAVQVDAVLIAGDLVSSMRNEYVHDFKQMIRHFEAPTYYVPGNHDVGDKVLPEKQGVTSARVAKYEMALGPSYWVQQIGWLRVIGLNSSLFASGLPEEEQQWAFLENLLDPRTDPVPTVLLMHHPPFSKTPLEPGGVYWNIEPTERARLTSMAQRAGVMAILSGHLHYSIAHNLDGIQYVTSPPVSFGLPRGKRPQGWTLLTLHPNGDVICENQIIEDDA